MGKFILKRKLYGLFENMMRGLGDSNSNWALLRECTSDFIGKNIKGFDISANNFSVIIEDSPRLEVAIQGNEDYVINESRSVFEVRGGIGVIHLVGKSRGKSEGGRIIVRLPLKSLKDIRVRTSNGSIKVSVPSIDTFSLYSDNGEIKVETQKFKQGEARTSNGDIKINPGCKVDLVSYKTSNGSVKIEHSKLDTRNGAPLSLYTENGDIKVL